MAAVKLIADHAALRLQRFADQTNLERIKRVAARTGGGQRAETREIRFRRMARRDTRLPAGAGLDHLTPPCFDADPPIGG